ncbi:4F2 cell-surface antigen heavy chain [Plecturocebus cupreus]
MESHRVGQAGLKLLASSDPLASASQNAGITETGFHYIGQAGPKLLTSSDLPALASQSAGITDPCDYQSLALSPGARLECSDATAVVRSGLTATSASWVQAILLPQPPERGSHSITQTGVQWCDLGTRQPPSLRFNDSHESAS